MSTILFFTFFLFTNTESRIFRSINEMVHSGDVEALDGKTSVSVVYPKGPFSLVAHAYNERDGAVWRVKDRENREYDLKVFMINVDRKKDDRERRTQEFAKEKARMLKLGKMQCPDLAKPVEGQEIQCTDRHIQIALASDVQVIDDKTGNVVSPEMHLQVPNSQGKPKNRRVVFTSNILFEAMPGGILSKVLKTRVKGKGEHTVRKFATFVHRYPVFVSVAPQLVDGLRFIHSQGLVHLSLDASSVLCKDSLCKRAVITDLTTSWDGKDKAPVEAHESMQPSVRFALFYGRGAFDDQWPSEKIMKTIVNAPANISVSDFEKNSTLQDAAKVEEEVMFNPLLSVSPLNFNEARSVDWYALGAILFYSITGQRPMVDDFKDTSLSKLGMGTNTADFVHSSLMHMFSGNKQTKLFKAVEKHVTEAMLLVDGLLQESRKDRISFDDGIANLASYNFVPKKLRRSPEALLQTSQESVEEMTPLDPKMGNSCYNFVSGVAKKEYNLQVEAASLPPFMSGICRA